MTRILLATDGSAHSEAAVDEVAGQPHAAGSAVHVISVIGPAYFPTPPYPFGVLDMSLDVQMGNDARQMAQAAVEKAEEMLRANEHARGLDITTAVISGSPKHAILEEAEAFGADLIVVGAQGHGMFDRFLLGSVSQAVALHARCSVEIVRRPNNVQKK